MRAAGYLFVIFIIITAGACQRDHFLKDKDYRQKVEAQYEKQKQLGKKRWEQVFRIADGKMPLQEKEALKFLLAYSPLSDIADYDGEFFLANIRASFAARDTFHWGKSVPDEIFRHFVLPVRVNNENLDTARLVFFPELKDRIKKLGMKDAVLEVNHWCHEKVTYRGSDERTSSPLATVRTAYGRCGEESTFTVAALRSVCIPARQCYTPRWAHCDDNHAWVEVWVDGKWHFIGACEPEAVLDAAWFTAPAKRAMLVSTNVFGDYQGPEDILVKDERFTRINVLGNYTETKRVFVQVKDTAGKSVDSAAVEFQLYNYAEFYPLYRTITDRNGLCSFSTGYGDLLAWASKNGKYAFSKLRVRSTDTLKLVLSLNPGREYELEEDFVPPPEQPSEVRISDSLKAANTRKLEFEDKLRTAYEQTFIDSSKAVRLAATLRLNGDTLWHYLKLSRGNYRNIIDFAASASAGKKQWIFPVLSVISEKDLRDVPSETLLDHIENTKIQSTQENDREIFTRYILNPRVDNELLKPWRSYLAKCFDEKFKDAALADPGIIVKEVSSGVVTDKQANFGRAPLSPVGVYELKVADPHSRDIYFVALCRSLGVPARLEPGTRLPQYYHKERWIDVYFEKTEKEKGERVNLTLLRGKPGRDPEYYINFTLEKFSDGYFRSLDYETDARLKTFPCTLSLAKGYYLLVTGTRLKDGTVMSHLSFFSLIPGKPAEKTIELRKETLHQVLGIADIPRLDSFFPTRSGKPPRFMILAWLEPDKEPSKHFVADLKGSRKAFSSPENRITLLFRDGKDKQGFMKGNGNDMPPNTEYHLTNPGMTTLFSDALKQKTGSSLPTVILINQKGEILYLSEGYRIGIGDELLRLMK